MVAAYALGVIAPSVAFAHADRDAVAHVLSETHGGAVILHFHPDGERHDHSGKAGKLDHRCCGVTALAGIEPPADAVVVQPVARHIVIASVSPSLAGLGAARLDRPPR